MPSPSPPLEPPTLTNAMAEIDVFQKYEEEREKRLVHADGRQYIDLVQTGKYEDFIGDPWVLAGTPVNTPVPNGGQTKAVILGAGIAGILYAAKLIDAGFKSEDLLMLDVAGGFGGTWYWNRYPGAMCDVDSSIYLPMLEKTGYVPKRKYSTGWEIREYLEALAAQYGLDRRAMFQSAAKDMEWDEEQSLWTVRIESKPKGGSESQITIRSNFVVITPGVLSNAHIPAVDGIETFRGHMFHSARWDYKNTGGSDKDATMPGLAGKRVAIIGTGASAVQSVPALAQAAEKLLVVQRTPSGVDVRGNRDTDPEVWKASVATTPGWQRERNGNFAAFVNDADPLPDVDMVNDGWTKAGTIHALVGGPAKVTMENVGDFVKALNARDVPRQDRVRQRVLETVEDRDTAESLQAWYPTWCKRACFHDEYLQAFNSPNVRLIDTRGRGIDRVTEHGFELGGKEYEVDVIIWSTGFRSPLLGSPAARANVTVRGRGGRDMEAAHEAGELIYLYGAATRYFPNMFYMAVSGTCITVNYTYTADETSSLVAYIISTALERVGLEKRPVVEPTEEALSSWGVRMAQGAIRTAGMAGCTPGYLNDSGRTDRMTPEQQAKLARSANWSDGMKSYLEYIDSWRATGKMEGIEVTAGA